jgi:predicted GNAT family acetyltransferase
MVAWKIFDRKSPAKQQVITGRFEIEQRGEVAYLEYTMTGNVLGLTHTEVPEKLRHLGIAAALAENALKWARENNSRWMLFAHWCRNTSPSIRNTPILFFDNLRSHSDCGNLLQLFSYKLAPLVPLHCPIFLIFEARCPRSPHHWPVYIFEATVIICTRLICILP